MIITKSTKWLSMNHISYFRFRRPSPHSLQQVNHKLNLPFKLYSTLGGISFYARLSKMPLFSSSFNLIAKVLLLKPWHTSYVTFIDTRHHNLQLFQTSYLILYILLQYHYNLTYPN